MNLPLVDASKGHDIPTLNASEIPHAVRHGAIHGALGTLNVGESMILIAPHDPLPLLNEVASAKNPSTVTTSRRTQRKCILNSRGPRKDAVT